MLKWTGPDLLIFQSWKKNALQGSFWIHLSPWLVFWVFFCRTKWKKVCEEIYLWAKKSLLKSLFPEWSRRVGGGFMFVCSQFCSRHSGLCLYKQQRGLNCSLDGCHGLYIWMTGRLLIMFLIVRLLTSVTFSLSSSLCPPNTHLYSLAHIHALFC